MKRYLTLIALLVAGINFSAAARSVEMPHGGHHGGGHHSGHYAGHYAAHAHHAAHYHHAYHYHPNYYSHMHFATGNCEKRYERCVRRHPSHPSRCRQCR